MANIAPLATVTASSENPGDSQEAIRAIDTVIDGYPGDYTKEWATLGEGVGAWIQLDWSGAHTVDHVKLYDRPNSNDWITGGTLTFSAGSPVSTGSIDNGGAETTVAFSSRSITWIRLTIDSVGPGTANIGLAEFEVYDVAGGISVPTVYMHRTTQGMS